MPIHSTNRVSSLLHKRVITNNGSKGVINHIFTTGEFYPIEVMFDDGEVEHYTATGYLQIGCITDHISLMESDVGLSQSLNQLFSDFDITADELIAKILEEHC